MAENFVAVIPTLVATMTPPIADKVTTAWLDGWHARRLEMGLSDNPHQMLLHYASHKQWAAGYTARMNCMDRVVMAYRDQVWVP